MAGRTFTVLLVSAASIAAFGVAAPVAEAAAKAPAKVSKAKVTSVSSTSAALSWKVPRSAGGTVVRVAKGKKAPKTPKAGRAVATLGKKKHTVKVTRLRAGTVYSVSLFAKSGGRYAKATVVRLQTAPAAVTGLYAQTSQTAIALRWTLPSRSAKTTIVRYSTGKAPAKPSAGKAVPVRGRAHGAILKGLRPGINYRFSLWAVDKAHRLSPRVTATFATGRPTTGVVTGFVSEAGTKKPLRGARVYLSGDEDFTSVATTTNGSYVFTAITAGHYDLRVFGYDATGGTSKAGWISRLVANVVVTAGKSKRIDVALAKAAGVKGKAIDAVDSSAVSDAFVYAPGSEEDIGFSDDSETDDDGTFVLPGLDPKQAKSVCVDDSYAEYSDDASTGHQQKCQAVSLVAGEIVDVGTLSLARGAALAGTIDLNGSYEADVTVFDSAGEAVGYGYVSDEDGEQYKVGGLPAGKVTVCVSGYEDDADDDGDDGNSSSDFPPQCYDGTADGVAWNPATNKPAPGALPVDVVVGQTKKPIDFEL